MISGMTWGCINCPVVIPTRYGLDGTDFEPRQWQQIFSLLLNRPHGLWGPPKLLFKWVLALFAGATLPECEVSHTPQMLRMRGVIFTLLDIKRGNFALCCPSLAKSDTKLTWLWRCKPEYSSFLTLDVIKLFVRGLNSKLNKWNEI